MVLIAISSRFLNLIYLKFSGNSGHKLQRRCLQKSFLFYDFWYSNNKQSKIITYLSASVIGAFSVSCASKQKNRLSFFCPLASLEAVCIVIISKNSVSVRNTKAKLKLIRMDQVYTYFINTCYWCKLFSWNIKTIA